MYVLGCILWRDISFWVIIFLDKKEIIFKTEHFCWEIVKFYQFWSSLLQFIFFGSGVRIRTVPDPDPQHCGKLSGTGFLDVFPSYTNVLSVLVLRAHQWLYLTYTWPTWYGMLSLVNSPLLYPLNRVLLTCIDCSACSGAAAGPPGRRVRSSDPPPGHDVGSLEQWIGNHITEV